MRIRGVWKCRLTGLERQVDRALGILEPTLDHGAREALLIGLGQGASRSSGGDGRDQQHRQLGGEGLGRRHADLGASQDRQHQVGFASDRAFGNVDHRQDGLLLLPGVADRRQRIDGLARL